MPIAIMVHGGAGNVTPDRAEIVQEGCKEAALIGLRILQAGGSALDAVEAAVRCTVRHRCCLCRPQRNRPGA